MAVLTSIAKHYHFSDIFARQLKTLAEPGDIATATATDIEKNILKAVEVGKKRV